MVGTTSISGPVSVGGATLTTNELSYLDGATGNLQTQIDAIDTSNFAPTTRATAALFFGDSVVEGYSASSAANTWWRRVADHYGWTYTNLAFSGAVVTDLNWQSQPGYDHTNTVNSTYYVTPLTTATNFTLFAKVGINDGADFPTTSGDHAAYLTHYYQSWLYFASYWATPGKTLASAATNTGSWSDWTNHFSASVGRQTTTSGDTIDFGTQGDAIYVGFPVSLTNTTSFGQFWVSIDGTAVELVDPNGTGYGNRNQWTTPVAYIPFSATNAFWAKRYSGYGERRHTVTITATNNTTYPTVVLWAAGSQQPIGPNSGPSVFLLENLNRAANATRDATYGALREQVGLVAERLGSDGLQVALIKPNSVYDTDTGMTGPPDNIHPNDTGMEQVARAVRQAVDRFRGLALPVGGGSGSGSGLTAAGSGLTDSSGTVRLGGTLTQDATLTGGSHGFAVSRTSAGNPAIKATVGASTYGVQIDADSSFPLVVTSSGTPVSYWRKTLGTVSSPSAITSGTVIWEQRFMAYDGSAYDTGVKFTATATENWSGSAHGSNLGIYTVPAGSTTPTLSTLFNASGNVTMAYDLSVDDVTATTLSAANTAAAQITATRYNTGTGGANMYLRHARGTEGSPMALDSGDAIGTLNFGAYSGAGFVNAAYITGATTEAHTSTNSGAALTIGVIPNGTTTAVSALVLNNSGSASFYSGVTIPGTLTLSGLTSGRLPLVTGSGAITDNSAFTYTSNTHLNVPTLYASTAIELGNATANTLTASGGVLSIEGVKVNGGEFYEVALSDETTAITTGTAKVTVRAPFAMTITAVRASLSTASSSGIPTVDINESGVSIFTTNLLTIDANEKTSTTAATAPNITDTSIADDAELTFDIDVAGTGAKGLKVRIYYTR